MDALEQHLQALENSSRYRVDAVLKRSQAETTERVFLRTTAKDGSIAEEGPFIRKTISRDAGLGASYQRLWDAQCAGQRFQHLPQLISFWQDADHLFVVMECAPGVTLDEWVEKIGPGMATARQLFAPICEGIMELHQRFDPPIIHRDIKPANVMVSAERVTIIDMGIARTFDSGASQDTKHFGTRAYAPPEQYGFGQTDQRSDVYATGLLLYFLLTGESAYETKARERGFASPAVPAAMQGVLMRATAFDPSQRYSSVADLLRAFYAADQKSAAPLIPSASEPLPRSRTGKSQLAGKVWNGILAADLAFWALMCVSLVVSPEGGMEVYSPGSRVLINGGLFLLFFLPMTYVLMDKRRLRQRHPATARLGGKRLAALVAVCLLVLLAILAFQTPVSA